MSLKKHLSTNLSGSRTVSLSNWAKDDVIKGRNTFHKSTLTRIDNKKR